MKLEKRTIEEWIYTSGNGLEEKLTEMDSTHLLNAFTKSCFDYNDSLEAHSKILSGDIGSVMDTLKQEILRRMKSDEK